MRRKSIRPQLLFIAALICIMACPKEAVDRMRGISVAMLAPSWEYLHHFKVQFGSLATFSTGQRSLKDHQNRHYELELENLSLKAEVERLRALLTQEPYLKLADEPSLKATPAKVIFRSPSSWSSSLWINIGSAHGLISKNSPVVLGDSLVGVIDYVDHHQSRVRLITDSSLVPSVRVIRLVDGKLWYLAKGEVQGSSQPLWRSCGETLKGIGFNYDFSDEKGVARDLRSGEAIDHKSDTYPTMPIIQEGDTLITTGMDGLFPEGLRVATVLRISPLKEGDYYFELEAVPTAGDLSELHFVFVLPAVSHLGAFDLPLDASSGSKS